MNSAPPKNSTRSIRGPPLGTSRFRARPAKNAPTIPTTSATTAEKNPASNTAYRTVRSGCKRVKVHRTTRGNTTKHHVRSSTNPITILPATVVADARSTVAPATAASTTSASVSVRTVAPTVTATAGSAVTARRRTSG